MNAPTHISERTSSAHVYLSYGILSVFASLIGWKRAPSPRRVRWTNERSVCARRASADRGSSRSASLDRPWRMTIIIYIGRTLSYCENTLRWREYQHQILVSFSSLFFLYSLITIEKSFFYILMIDDWCWLIDDWWLMLIDWILMIEGLHYHVCFCHVHEDCFK